MTEYSREGRIATEEDRDISLPEVRIDGILYAPAADSVHVYGMYDNHLFHRIKGSTVDQVIDNWRAHNSEPHPAVNDQDKVFDLGPSSLCPAIVLCGAKELRRVGKMVFPKRVEELEAYRTALESDPDISRLLGAT